ncbi:CGNR zinc finger domain-containing protein [Rhizobium cauense]|uniref:CGNR zinc finger domain-containing protein n=1 Tax=Rhizobium cauense TaxID=1166683 RepID=UPI001C6E372D|nr:CGNR zinc finger domain-containing protein [Rhizobium cauense]MBW9113527.1 CGNR zinc finger domain-containing protein [Rhizobium cauense]
MAKSVHDMRLSGGHPALDFVNTVDSRRGRIGPDLLLSYDDLVILAGRVALLTPGDATYLREKAKEEPEEAALLLERAIAFREASYNLFLEEDRSGHLGLDHVATVENEVLAARAGQRLELANGALGWKLPLRELPDLFFLFVLATDELLTARKERRPVKECKGDNCGWLFLDHSKGGRRIWCSDASCGTHNRVKRFRSK